MEEEFSLKIKLLKEELINLSDNKDFLKVKKNETWESYLERILKVKKPICMIESFIFIILLSDNFELSTKEKNLALDKLNFCRRS